MRQVNINTLKIIKEKELRKRNMIDSHELEHEILGLDKRIKRLVIENAPVGGGGGGGVGVETDPVFAAWLLATPPLYPGGWYDAVQNTIGLSGFDNDSGFITSFDDEKVKYDAGDPTAGYVADKIIAGTGISVAEGTGANENKLVVTSDITQYTDSDAIAAIQGDASWNATNWDTAYGWGNHAGLYLPIATVLPSTETGASNNFLTAYNATTGAFSKARPTWADIDKTTSSIADITTRSHTALTDIGTLTHATIDSYLDQAVLTTSTPSFNGATLTGNLLINNNVAIRSKDTGGTIRRLFIMNSSDILEIGASAGITKTILNAGSTGTIEIGVGTAGVDYALTFNGETNDGTLTWMEDENYFQFADEVVAPSLILDQGAADTYILEGRSSDVTQPATAVANTNTFLMAKKDSATAGGGAIWGFSDGDATGLTFYGLMGTTTPTAARGAVRLNGIKTDGGTGFTTMGAAEAVVAVYSSTTVLDYFSGDGSLYVKTGSTNPSTQANFATLYAKDVSSSAEMFVQDEAGNRTQISPHDPDTGEWIFYSENIYTGRKVKIEMEKLVRAVEKLTGETFFVESFLPEEERKSWEERSVDEEGLSKSEIDKIKAEKPPEYIRKELNATRVS